jgi:predicted NAD/FAD-binding protein
VWDTAPDKLFNEFPVRTLVQFMKNHNLLQIMGAPKWLTVGGGRWAIEFLCHVVVLINSRLLQ